jgi:hypothetical protein
MTNRITKLEETDTDITEDIWNDIHQDVLKVYCDIKMNDPSVYFISEYQGQKPFPPPLCPTIRLVERDGTPKYTGDVAVQSEYRFGVVQLYGNYGWQFMCDDSFIDALNSQDEPAVRFFHKQGCQEMFGKEWKYGIALTTTDIYLKTEYPRWADFGDVTWNKMYDAYECYMKPRSERGKTKWFRSWTDRATDSDYKPLTKYETDPETNVTSLMAVGSNWKKFYSPGRMNDCYWPESFTGKSQSCTGKEGLMFYCTKEKIDDLSSDIVWTDYDHHTAASSCTTPPYDKDNEHCFPPDWGIGTSLEYLNPQD